MGVGEWGPSLPLRSSQLRAKFLKGLPWAKCSDRPWREEDHKHLPSENLLGLGDRPAIRL